VKTSWLCVALVGVVLLSHAEARSGRTLTSQESWSMYGGSNEKCRTTMGRCYADPAWDDCVGSDSENCDNAVKSNSTATCQNDTDPEANCIEQGAQVSCVFTTVCDWEVVNEEGACKNGEWRGIVDGPANGSMGVDCQ